MCRIILKCPTATRLSALAQWRRSLRVTPPLHLRSMRGTTGTPCLQSPLRWSCPRHRRLHPLLIHPVHPVVGVSLLSPSNHPTIASTIGTLVQTQGGRGGGRNTTNTPTTKNLLRGGEALKSRRNLLSPSGGRRLRTKNTPRSLQPRGPMRRRTPLRWGTSITSQKMFSLPRGTFVHALSSYGHVYSFSSEGCTKCK